MKKYLTACLLLLTFSGLVAQNEDLTTRLYDTYEKYRVEGLSERRIKHKDLQPLLENVGKKPGIEVSQVGMSIEGRPLRLVSLGEGEMNVFLWSQMHGNEPTATQAIFDILNFMTSPDFQDEKREILKSVRLHFLPMLNPDGAQVFKRRNALSIDINRDALRLQSPEGRTLKRVRDSLQADFGFNLHDQSTYYNAERTSRPATISYLAPAYNYEKEVNEVRANAMRVIGFMNRIIQKYAPGQVGRYNDDFEPRAFGDNIQKWGTSLILIESGGFPDDVEKQHIRKLNYVSILSAVYAIATGDYAAVPLSSYEEIPENDRKLFDLKIENATYPLLGKEYVIDIGIQRPEVDTENHDDFWYSSRIIDIGDLSTYYGYKTIDAEGYRLQSADVYSQVQQDLEAVSKLDFWALISRGIAYVRVKQLPSDLINSPYPVHLVSESFKLPSDRINIGTNPTFFLGKGKELQYAVINGFLYHIPSREGQGKNSMIYR